MSLLQSNQFFEMQSALEHYNEHRTTQKMTTGSVDLDSLIDGIQEGMFYLFYGNKLYTITYAAEDNKFMMHLPDVTHMINSLRIANSTST